ncbi:MAG: hypothetical protein V4490_08445 [Pseudomonadota bacterium]
MKTLTKEMQCAVFGGKTVEVGVTTTGDNSFDWMEFSAISAGLAAAGAILGAFAGAGKRRTRGEIVGSALGGALLAGGLGAAGDSIHQLSPTGYYRTDKSSGSIS